LKNKINEKKTWGKVDWKRAKKKGQEKEIKIGLFKRKWKPKWQ